MTFAEVCDHPYIRRRCWPLGHFATRLTFGGSWYYERHHKTRDLYEFYALTLDVPGDDWERHNPFGTVR